LPARDRRSKTAVQAWLEISIQIHPGSKCDISAAHIFTLQILAILGNLSTSTGR